MSEEQGSDAGLIAPSVELLGCVTPAKAGRLRDLSLLSLLWLESLPWPYLCSWIDMEWAAASYEEGCRGEAQGLHDCPFITLTAMHHRDPMKAMHHRVPILILKIHPHPLKP